MYVYLGVATMEQYKRLGDYSGIDGPTDDRNTCTGMVVPNVWGH